MTIFLDAIESLEHLEPILLASPTPVSSTSNCTSSSAARLRSVTRPPSGVYLIAFESRLIATCIIKSRSASTARYKGLNSAASVIRSAAAVGRTISSVAESNSLREMAFLRNVHHAGFDPSDIQQIVDQPVQPIGLDADHAQEFFASVRVVGIAVGEQFDIRFDSGQRRFHFVADRGDELGIALLTGFRLGRVAEHGKSSGRLSAVVGAISVV